MKLLIRLCVELEVDPDSVLRHNGVLNKGEFTFKDTSCIETVIRNISLDNLRSIRAIDASDLPHI